VKGGDNWKDLGGLMNMNFMMISRLVRYFPFEVFSKNDWFDLESKILYWLPLDEIHLCEE